MTITIQWYCSYFVGSYKWQTTEILEPDKCDTEWITIENRESWEAGECYAVCPGCRSILEVGVPNDDL